MQAIEIKQPGGPEVLVPTQRPDPVPKAGELLIAVTASGINRPDVLQRMGMYPDASGVGPPRAGGGGSRWRPALPEPARRLKVGDRVCALVAGGGYAELCGAAPAGQCLPVPEGLSDMRGGGAAGDVLHRLAEPVSTARARAGRDATRAGRASGIGIAAIQSGQALGVRVIVTAGSDPKSAPPAMAQGAELAINYQTRLRRRDPARTGGGGVDVMLDMVGGDYMARDIDCCPRRAGSQSSRFRAAAR